jgi:hypothetical protein
MENIRVIKGVGAHASESESDHAPSSHCLQPVCPWAFLPDRNPEDSTFITDKARQNETTPLTYNFVETDLLSTLRSPILCSSNQIYCKSALSRNIHGFPGNGAQY